MKLEPYWLASSPRFMGGAAGPLQGKVDVAIVGGGFTGLSAALALAKSGASVAVLEAGRVVGEASGRNGGHCNNGLFYATGYSGHGTQMSVHMGAVMARVMGGDAKANPLAELDWPAVPGHFGPPWFLPFVGMYYRYQDWRH